MADKSFRQILEEKLNLKAAPVTPTKASEAIPFPWYEIRVERPHQPLNRYPHRPRVEKVPPAATTDIPKIDPKLDITHLNPEEVAALHVLGLKSAESVAHSTIRRLYRRRVLDLHPDRQPADLPAMTKELLTREFQTVHEAYMIIEKALKRLAPRA